MNTKIQELIDLQVISVKDILEYADSYQWEQMMMSSQYECSEGTLHQYDEPCYCQLDREQCEWEMWEQEQMVDERPAEPEYIIASTSYKMEETYVFQADKDGNIVNFGEYGGIAKRWGCDDWTNKDLAVETTFGQGKYIFVKSLPTDMTLQKHQFNHNLYVKYEPEYPLPQDSYDGGQIKEP